MKERYSEAQTRKVAEKLLSLITPHKDKATVVGLSGELGAGKTTLTQELAKLLGVKESVQSPTFVIAKFYGTQHESFDALAHLDAYRIESESELDPLGWESLLLSPRTLIIIEWPERIAAKLPEHALYFLLSHEGEERTITKK